MSSVMYLRKLCASKFKHNVILYTVFKQRLWSIVKIHQFKNSVNIGAQYVKRFYYKLQQQNN